MIVRRATMLLVGLTACTAAGCSMCCGVYDYAYPTFGGKYERVDPEFGRVGSIYSDPLAEPGVPAITNADVPVEPRTPIDIDMDGDEFDGDELQSPIPTGPLTDNVPNSGTTRLPMRPARRRWR